MSAVWENRPNPTLRRVEMWCARNWAEAKHAGLAALASPDVSSPKEYRRHRLDEGEWFAALLVVNRISLGIEPLDGTEFLEAEGSRLARRVRQ